MLLISKLTAIALLLAAIVASAQGNESFEYYRAYDVELENAEQVRQFQEIDIEVNVLSDVGPEGGSLKVVVAPKHRIDFEEKLKEIGAKFKCILDNLREALEERLQAPPGHSTPDAPAMEWTKYHSLKDIDDYSDYLAKRYPLLVKTLVVGFSHELRPIKAVIISSKPGNKAIFMEANTHAIEWVSSAAITCFIDRLLTSNDQDVKDMRWNYDWIIMPMVNPDGFAYTKVPGQELWRKNRRWNGSFNSSGLCYGVDLNRNFDDGHHLEAGYNVNNTCDHWYGGKKPNSEPEVKVLQNFYNIFPPSYIVSYFAWHSFGNWVLLPYGHTNATLPPNYAAMKDASDAFVAAAFKKHGTKFVAGPSGTINYPVSGSGKDWAYNKKKVCYSATLELRPYSNSPYMFFLPASQIIPTCEEVLLGLIGFLKRAEEIKLFKTCRVNG